MLEINNLVIKVKDKYLVDDISFSLKEKQNICIIGESGSGKTLTALSIMKLLDEKIYCVQGSIKLFGEEILQMKEEYIAKKRLSEIALIYQNPFNALSPCEKISKQIKRIHKIKNVKTDNEKIKEVLNFVDMDTDYLDRYPFELSGGQLQRIIIAISIFFNPKILILDEPTTSLDMEVEMKILKLLDKLKIQKEISTVFITHNLDIVREMSTGIIIMKDGKIIEKGSNKDIFLNPQSEYTKKLIEFSRLGD